jgi:putative endonuclease
LKAPHLLQGERGEYTARRWLESRGLAFIAANFRCLFGELDLVMLDGNCVVVVEVRYRRNSGYGGALMSVSPTKQHRLAKTTQCFLQQQKRLRNMPLRFDVLALSGNATAPKIDWRRSAFCFDTED